MGGLDAATWISIGAIFVLLAISGFFSGSETAFTAASRARMHQLATKGSARAETVNALRARSESLIGAILLGNNLVNILASALATSVLISLVGEGGVAVATIAMTLLVVVFAEILPKTYAINHPDKMALTVAPVVRILTLTLGPVTHTIQIVVRAVFRAFGARIESDLGKEASEEELRGAIELHEGEGEEVEEERKMLRSILDLDDVEVGDIMVHRSNVTMIDISQSNDEIFLQVVESPHTRLPLWRDEPDNIIGVLHAKSLLKEARRTIETGLDDIDIPGLAAKPWFIPDTTTLHDQLQAFRARREHFAMVVDEYGSFMGIVTLEDILEEIVGEISDETDLPVIGIRKQPDGSYLVDGQTQIRDLVRELGWPLPDDEASTLAGLLLHESRRIPEVGQIFSFYGFRFEVLHRQRQQITLIRVTPPPEVTAATQAE
ncbi:MAG: HlyC/CorC family transporter [Alphaproteobacteria bacterium]|nr:HlyC/CorC family transporter [Alphaproteobacteria bacterium]